MGEIERAVEAFKRKQLEVYKADPQRIVRDTRGAERAAKDHTGRWLFELLQNSDDAQALEVKIIVTDDTIYVADNGKGFKPEAVSSICGTDFSDKISGTIGRKGVGFKSVYEISSHPQLLTVGGEGVEFSPERTGEWLRQNGFKDGHVPYQWIPFVIPWDVAIRQAPILEKLKDYKTVVRLSKLSVEKRQIVEQLLKDWPVHALFPFRYVRKLNGPDMEVVMTPGEGIWQLYDSRGQIPQFWSVLKPDPEYVPEELTGTLGEEEKNAIQTDGVSFLIAAPLFEDRIKPTEGYLPIHVFYPTEQKGPVRLLLHAEFMVKSDRTALIPIENGSFNEWVADRLAHHVCAFVNNSFRSKNPSSHAALLVPFSDRESHPVADRIWKFISIKATADLRLADVECNQRLAVGDAILISVSIRPELARTLLELTKFRGQLLHRDFDGDIQARKALKELSCKEIQDQDLMDMFAANADSRSSDTSWIWSCWDWLSEWVDKEPYGDKRRERIARTRLLPIVPVDGRLCRPADLKTHIVTWRPDGHVDNLPNWLPLTFVDDWFRDQIQSIAKKDDPVMKLCNELGIKAPGSDVIQRAIGRAIAQYWKDKQGNPGRFLSFILEQDWHETSEALEELERCPVPLSQSVQKEGWDEARKVYFGHEWGNDLLADLYDGIADVIWVQATNGEDDKNKRRQVLEWLGVSACPRVIVERYDVINVWELPTDCNDWKKYLDAAQDPSGRYISRISGIRKIDHLALDSLSCEQAVLLVRLIARHWDYYGNEAETTAQGARSREQYYREWNVKAKWWWEVCEQLSLPKRNWGVEHVGLTALWLLDKRAERTMGELLPVVDLDAFGDAKDEVHKWFENVVHLRTRIAQVTVEEWKSLLSNRIPNLAPVERLTLDERLRDRVTGWYTVCLETVAEDEKKIREEFEQCPLLCQKGNEWKYVGNGETRYLVDDNDFAKAFADDIWLFHVPARLANDTMKYFSIKSLSEFVIADVAIGEPKSPLSDGMLARFKESLPYVYVWRSSQNKQDAETLSNRLKKLQVHIVPSLKANLSLNGIWHEVEQHWYVLDGTIYLHGDHTNEAALALALAKMVGVPSEADFYENLLRCDNDNQRKEKLLSKGIAEAEIERSLREHSGHAGDVEVGKDPEETKKKGAEESAADKKQPEDKTQQKQAASDKQGTAQGKPQSKAVSEQASLSLKDSLTVGYVIGEPPHEGGAVGGGGGGGGASQEGQSLTEEEKAKLEKAGRDFSARELQKMGYIVEHMPRDNPGFDLKATKEREELRVEVKGHTGRATVVDVTQREYKEYLGQGNYRWELWNVEHLSQDDAAPVTITRYIDIPDSALDVRTFRVDLKKCQAPRLI